MGRHTRKPSCLGAAGVGRRRRWHAGPRLEACRALATRVVPKEVGIRSVDGT